MDSKTRIIEILEEYVHRRKDREIMRKKGEVPETKKDEMPPVSYQPEEKAEQQEPEDKNTNQDSENINENEKT